MGSMVNIIEEISTLFTSAQVTAACHQKNSLLLRKVYLQADFDKFNTALQSVIDLILLEDCKQKNPYVDRMIEFLGVFFKALQEKRKTNDEDLDSSYIEDPLITRSFERLIQGTRAISDTIRFRCCQLINNILNHLVGNEISNELCEQLQEVLVDLLSDAKSVVRLQAVEALYRLQDPGDLEDIIINEFLRLLLDSNAKVRALCVEKIAARKDVIHIIIGRTRDIDPTVRLEAFKRLTKFPKFLKITDRTQTLFAGMYDSSEKVKKYVLTEFLSSWLEVYDSNIITFMRSLRLDADENDIEKTMDLYRDLLNNFYFKTKTMIDLSTVLNLNEEKLLPYDQLSWETISYWKLYVTFLSQNDEMETYYDNAIPEFVYFARYIKGYSDYLKDCMDEVFIERQHILKELFLIIRTYDLADPTSRQSLHKLVDFVLKKVDLIDEVVETVVGTLESSMPDPKVRCQFGCEIVYDLLYPIDKEEEIKQREQREIELTKLKVQLNCLQEDQFRAVEVADYMEAEKLKHEIFNISMEVETLKKALYTPVEDVKKTDDLAVLFKCLDIAFAILRTAKVSKLIPPLKSLKTDFIPDMLIHQNEIVRMKALRCYAICCIYDKPTAQNGIHIFAVPIAAYQAGEECDTQTLKICVAAVSDLIRIYGADLMAEPNEDQLNDSVNEEHQKVFTGGTSLTTLVQGLVDLMDDEQLEIQLCAAQGLCKLVLDERIHSSPLISRLILKWCHPIDKDEPESEVLKQFIGCVLQEIPRLPNSSEQLENAVLLTIYTLAKAPRTSPLYDVDIDNIAKFMLALCRVSREAQRIHGNIALSICTKLNQQPNSKINSIYSKILLMINIPDNTDMKNNLYRLCEQARENMNNITTLKHITKFLASLVEEPIKEDNNMSSEDVSGEEEVV